MDIEAVQPPGGPAHHVRGLHGDKVFRRVRPGRGVLLVAKPLLLPMDAITGESHGPGHGREDEHRGRRHPYDRCHAPHPGQAGDPVPASGTVRCPEQCISRRQSSRCPVQIHVVPISQFVAAGAGPLPARTARAPVLVTGPGRPAGCGEDPGNQATGKCLRVWLPKLWIWRSSSP